VKSDVGSPSAYYNYYFIANFYCLFTFYRRHRLSESGPAGLHRQRAEKPYTPHVRDYRVLGGRPSLTRGRGLIYQPITARRYRQQAGALSSSR